MWQSPMLAEVPGVVHGFLGATDHRGAPLSLGTGAGSDDWERATAQMGGHPVAWCSQVHGADCVRVHASGMAGEADAMVTDQRGLLLAIRTADCVPIAVVGAHQVAAIHAGWRGLAAGVIEQALSGMEAPHFAAVGPCIGVDAYEVGPEVVAGINERVPRPVFVKQGPHKEHVDLSAACAHVLTQAGLAVDVAGLCTFSDRRFHSHRRDGAQAGRQALLVGLV